MAKVKTGITIYCVRCERVKKPIGRDTPFGMDHCTSACSGYDLEPYVGHLWPGETAAEFGYECSNDGTRMREEKVSHDN